MDQFLMIMMLLQNTLQKRSLNSSDEELLLKSAFDGNSRRLKRLLALEGINVNARSGVTGETPLIIAARRGHLTLIQQLIEAGAQIDDSCFSNCTALYEASKGGHIAVMECLIDNGANIELTNNKGFTPLMIASFLGQVPATTLLLDRGADKNKRDKAGHTPLMAASLEGHIDLVNLLLSHGANILFKGSEGNTALHFCCQKGHVAVAEVLIEGGANKDSKNKNGETPLMIACREKHEALVGLLIDNCADFEIRDLKGRTALLHACKSLQINIVKRLLSAGADPAIWSKRHKTTSIMVSCTGSGQVAADIIELLLSSGGLPVLDASDSDGNTALSIAVLHENFQCAKKLLCHGCQTELLNDDGLNSKSLADITLSDERSDIYELFNEMPVIYMLTILQEDLGVYLNSSDIDDLFQFFRSEREAGAVNIDEHADFDAFFNLIFNNFI